MVFKLKELKEIKIRVGNIIDNILLSILPGNFSSHSSDVVRQIQVVKFKDRPLLKAGNRICFWIQKSGAGDKLQVNQVDGPFDCCLRMH